jgi:superfamily II DNA or RNA helicase
MALLIAAGLQQKYQLRIGWVAMRRNLLEQARREIEKRGIDVQIKFLSMFEKNPPRDLDVLVVDEAQHDCTNSMMAIHGIVRPKFILGLSATPFRVDRLKLCFDSIIRDAGIHQLIQDGYLSQFQHYTIPRFTVEEVARCYLDDVRRWGKSIFYFHTIAQCNAAAQLLGAAGIAVEVVTGSSDREYQLDAFRRDRVQVLINSQVLVEGMDEPSLKTVFCRPSGCAPTIQMCGRVFRKYSAIPYKQVVQCQETRWPMIRTATAASQFMWIDGQWRTIHANEQLIDISQRTVHALATTNVELPRFLMRGNKLKRGLESLMPTDPT